MTLEQALWVLGLAVSALSYFFKRMLDDVTGDIKTNERDLLSLREKIEGKVSRSEFQMLRTEIKEDLDKQFDRIITVLEKLK